MITLAIIAKHGTASFRRLVDTAQEFVTEIVVVVDDNAEPGLMNYGADKYNIRYVQNALQNDFARQRNVACACATQPWILHLDTDETLAASLWPRLNTIVQAATADVIWLPRSTIIDFRPCAWPDWQPKLHKQHVRWQNPVHELPIRPHTDQYLEAIINNAILHEKTEAAQAIAESMYAHIIKLNSN